MKTLSRENKLVVFGIGLFTLGGTILYAMQEGEVPPRVWLSTLAGVALIGGGLFYAIGVILALRADLRGKSARTIVGRLAVRATPLLFAFLGYSLGFHWKETNVQCVDAMILHTIEARRQALDEATSRLNGPFGWLPERIGFRVSERCEAARLDLERLERGECPLYLPAAVPCQCGKQRWEGDRRCVTPTCSGHPRSLSCSNDAGLRDGMR